MISGKCCSVYSYRISAEYEAPSSDRLTEAEVVGIPNVEVVSITGVAAISSHSDVQTVTGTIPVVADRVIAITVTNYTRSRQGCVCVWGGGGVLACVCVCVCVCVWRKYC